MPARKRPMLPPDRITPGGPADYLEIMARAIFQAGMSWEVIARRWPGIVEAFGGFDPQRVSEIDESGIDELMDDDRVIRNRRKLEAVAANAGRILELAAEFDGFDRYLDAAGDFYDVTVSLKRDFRFMGDFGCYYFQYVIGREVPPYDRWRATLKSGKRERPSK